MAVLAPPKLTPDDVWRRADHGRGLELVNGELRESDVSKKSSYVAGEVFGFLRDFVRPRKLGWVFPEGTGFTCFPDSEELRKADTAYIRIDRLSQSEYDEDGYCSVCPDLVVEVISPNDLAYNVNEKRQLWLDAGVKLVWIIEPDDETVHAYTADGPVTLFRASDALTGEPVLPGFRCPVRELFATPGTS